MDRFQPDIRVLSEGALSLEWEPRIDPEQHGRILDCRRYLLSLDLPGLAALVPTFHALTGLLEPGGSPAACRGAIEEALPRWRYDPDRAPGGRCHEVPVRYGGDEGPDLEPLARARGLAPEEVVRLHASVEYYVYMIGFTPGFPYLGGLSEQLHHPRLSRPRVHVPAGSVGIGGPQTGIYPLDSPGGWHLIGRTDIVLFDADRDPPALLEPGDRIRFVPSAPGIVP